MNKVKSKDLCSNVRMTHLPVNISALSAIKHAADTGLVRNTLDFAGLIIVATVHRRTRLTNGIGLQTHLVCMFEAKILAVHKLACVGGSSKGTRGIFGKRCVVEQEHTKRQQADHD
jgi:hypothetical protein